MILSDNISDDIYHDAEYYAQKAKLANKLKLADVFKMIETAAESGQHMLTLSHEISLNEDQCSILEDLGFDVQESEDDNREKIMIILFEE